MSTYRLYLNKAIDPETGMGGDHSRFLDFEGADEDEARKQAKQEMEADEVIGDVTELHSGIPSADDLAFLASENKRLEAEIAALKAAGGPR